MQRNALIISITFSIIHQWHSECTRGRSLLVRRDQVSLRHHTGRAWFRGSEQVGACNPYVRDLSTLLEPGTSCVCVACPCMHYALTPYIHTHRPPLHFHHPRKHASETTSTERSSSRVSLTHSPVTLSRSAYRVRANERPLPYRNDMQAVASVAECDDLKLIVISDHEGSRVQYS